jgi:membrane-anchored protein YejM (alkaline phosphatase superfamily)
MILAETPRRKVVTQLVNWSHWFALLNIIIAVTIAAIYILNSPAPG